MMESDMDQDFSLTDKAIFPENHTFAVMNAVMALGIVIEFLDPIVRGLNSEDYTINLWDIARGLQASSEVYFTAAVK